MRDLEEIKKELVSICRDFSEFPEQVQAKVVEILGYQLTKDGVSPTEARDQKSKKNKTNRFDKNPPTEMPHEFLLGSPSSAVKSFREFCDARARPKAKHEYVMFALSVSYCQKELQKELGLMGLKVTLSRVYTCWRYMEWPAGDRRSFRQKITACNQDYDLFLVFDDTTTDDIQMSPAGTRYVEELLSNPRAKPTRRRIR